MTAKEAWKKNLNVPNVLSLIRLLMVPVYLFFFARGEKYAALATFALASLTDLLDGMIARKYGLVTDLGKLLDPLADKLMVLTALFSMTLGNDRISPVIPLPATLIVLVKELCMILGGALLLKKGVVVYSKLVGKAAQCLFIGGLIASYFHDEWLRLCPNWFLTPDLLLIWCAVVCAVCALVFYVTDTLRGLKEAAREQEPTKEP